MIIGPRFSHRVTVGGHDVPYVTEIHARFGTDQPVSTCSITMPVETASGFSDGDPVTVELAENGTWWDRSMFVGRLITPEKSLAVAGNFATLACVGPADRLALPLERDLAFTGGSKEAPQNVQTAAMHIGNDSISYYADPSPNGTSVDRDVTPLVDANFVWVAGFLHGTNDYPTDFGDRTIKKWSRVELWQNGIKLGYANFPENSERWWDPEGEDDPTDFGDIENWEPFERMIAATTDKIDASDGDITFRFISGQKPGGTLYDEYEVQQVTWQSAGKQSLRQLIRGICKSAGFTITEYNVNDGIDLDGLVIKLGGNGLVNAGQLLIAATESRLSWANGLANMFGYYLFDGPDGKIRMRPVRGIPIKPSVATFTQGVNIFGIPRYGRDASRVYNCVHVEGASGTDQSGKQFAYQSKTDPDDIVANDLIPNPPGIKTYRVSSNHLTSNGLCRMVREIAEVRMADAWLVDLETVPVWLYPSQTITVVSPIVGVNDEFFATSVAYDVVGDSYRMTLSGERGTAVPFDEADDPDPDEDDIVPTTPRPIAEWAGGPKPRAAVNL